MRKKSKAKLSGIDRSNTNGTSKAEETVASALTDIPDPWSQIELESGVPLWHGLPNMDWFSTASLDDLASVCGLVTPHTTTPTPLSYRDTQTLTQSMKRKRSVDVEAEYPSISEKVLPITPSQSIEQTPEGRELCSDKGRDANGIHRCSCGKGYPAKHNLKRHIGLKIYPCSMCAKAYTRQDVCRRHEQEVHFDRKAICPGCGKSFRQDYLGKHLSLPRNIDCHTAVATMWSKHGSLYHEPGPDLRAHEHREVIPTMDSLSEPAETTDVRAKTLAVDSIRSATIGPVNRTSSQPRCDLCRQTLDDCDQSVAEHLARHMNDFYRKPYRCDDCEISFAHRKDLEWHLRCAAKGNCGFSFPHYLDLCFGHHPPCEPSHKLELNVIDVGVLLDFTDHFPMRKAVEAWERSQLKAHKLGLRQLLHEHLRRQAPLPAIDAGCQTRDSTLPLRLSHSTIHSFRSAPQPRIEHNPEIEDLSAEFDRIMSGVAQQSTTTGKSDVHDRTDHRQPQRSDSAPTLALQSSLNTERAVNAGHRHSIAVEGYVNLLRTLKQPRDRFKRMTTIAV